MKARSPKPIQWSTLWSNPERPVATNQPPMGIRAWNRPKCHDSRKILRFVSWGRTHPTPMATEKASIAKPRAIEAMVSRSLKGKHSSLAAPED